MGDLDSEIKELKSLNLFFHAITGLPDIEIYPCFNSINYQSSLFPSFKITVSEDGTEKDKEITPDFLLWNIRKKTALILEIKGGNSIEEGDIEQIRKYLMIPIDQVEERVRNILEDPSIELESFYVGIVYYEKTIRNCLRSPNCINRLDSIKDDLLILKQSPGNVLNIRNPEFITFDDDLSSLLNNGIQIPKNPRRNIYITETPSIEGTMWAIINYVDDKFYEGDEINEIKIDPFQLRDIFIYSSVKLNRLSKALNYLSEIGCCIKEQNSYIFNLESHENLDALKSRIIQIDTGRLPSVQQDLSKY